MSETLYAILAFVFCVTFISACGAWQRRRERSLLFRVALIGISGKIGSGKSTLAANLAKSLKKKNFMVYERNFGDELKTAVAKRYNFDVQLCYSQEGKNTLIHSCNKTVGVLLQEFGTAERKRDENVWVNAVDRFIDEKSSTENIAKLVDQGYKGIVFIVPDVRFPNEAQWIGDESLLIRLEGDPQGVFAATTRDKTHISETALDDYSGFDLILDTDKYDTENCLNAAEEKLWSLKQFH